MFYLMFYDTKANFLSGRTINKKNWFDNGYLSFIGTLDCASNIGIDCVANVIKSPFLLYLYYSKEVLF